MPTKAKCENSLEKLGETSLIVAAIRAVESERSDPFVIDQYAKVLAGKRAMRYARGKSRFAHDVLVARERFFGEFAISASTGRDAPLQIVNLGAGMDTRAYRIQFPRSMIYFEVDQEPILRYKREALGTAGAIAKCDRREVPVDLRDNWGKVLLGKGFNPKRPTIWTIEGVLVWTGSDGTNARGILQKVTGLSYQGSKLGFDMPNAAMARAAKKSMRKDSYVGELDILGTNRPHELLPSLWREVRCTTGSRYLSLSYRDKTELKKGEEHLFVIASAGDYFPVVGYAPTRLLRE